MSLLGIRSQSSESGSVLLRISDGEPQNIEARMQESEVGAGFTPAPIDQMNPRAGINPAPTFYDLK